jgi:hypothetical protein
MGSRTDNNNANLNSQEDLDALKRNKGHCRARTTSYLYVVAIKKTTAIYCDLIMLLSEAVLYSPRMAWF